MNRICENAARSEKNLNAEHLLKKTKKQINRMCEMLSAAQNKEDSKYVQQRPIPVWEKGMTGMRP
jgi:hypothetical protein